MTDAERHEALVPMGCQVSSKGRHRFCKGHGPAWIEYGVRSHVYDQYRVPYLDLTCGLGAITLGHGHWTDRNNLMPAALPLPSRVELALAELVCALVPCAEQVRFLKTGTDATSACVRLSRVYTGRDAVLDLGSYHGWQDWSLDGAQEGAPANTRCLTSREASWPADLRRFACVILEPVSLEERPPGWLQSLRDACTAAGTVLIFDEVITGFRMHHGGAQALYGVTPDLCAMGKAMANGWPISLVAGRRDIMQCWARTHISGTHFSDPACMHAALLTLDEHQRQDYPAHCETLGRMFRDHVARAVADLVLSDHVSVRGLPHWWVLQFRDDTLQTIWQAHCLDQLVMTNGSHFIMLAHTHTHIEHAADVYASALQRVREAIDSGEPARFLPTGCEINRTFFRRA